MTEAEIESRQFPLEAQRLETPNSVSVTHLSAPQDLHVCFYIPVYNDFTPDPLI